MVLRLLQRGSMARRGLRPAALLGQAYPLPPFCLLSRSYSSKLFVGGLSFRTDEEAVRRAFAQHGEVVEVKLISDRETGRPKGFGFITFQSEDEAETARAKMTGQVLDGRVIRVDKAAASRPPLPSSSYGTAGSGGFSGMNSSPLSSNIPPVAEDWGTIPSNVVSIGQNAAAAPSSPPAAFETDSTKPFDSSSFGQAAAWPSSTSAPLSGQTSFNSSNVGSAAAATAPSSAVGSSTVPGSTPAPSSAVSGQTSSFDNSTFASTVSFKSNTFGSAVVSPSSAPDSSGSTPAPPSNYSGVSGQSSSFGNSTIDSADTTPGSTISSFSTSSTVVSSASTIPSAATIETSSATVSTTTSMSSSVATEIIKAPEPAPPDVSSTPASATPSAHPLSSPALTSSGSFDFSNFSFNSSSYREADPPLPRRRPRPRPRLNSQSSMSLDVNSNSSTASILETRSPFGSNNQFAETSIPKPKGPELDFGLLNITAPSLPGARPQGCFDIFIPDDLPELPPPEPKPKPKPMSLSMFPHRKLPAVDLPWDRPESDNWSEIGEDPPKYDLSSLFPSMGELIKKDKEFHWDPFEFDPEATLPPEEEVIEIDSDYD